MRRGHFWVGWLGCVAGGLWVSAGLADAQAFRRAPVAAVVAPGPLVGDLPLDELPPSLRERIRTVVLQPTLTAHAPAERFLCEPELYHWLLDHHDRVSAAWRRLGTPCVAITDRGNGRFGWSDGQGSDVQWGEVYRGPDLRLWYAEGIVRAGLLLPAVPVRAVVVLRHAEGRDDLGRPT
ncbi:MAG TPA: hypothetical protein VNK04_26105, partial [Gemmataceae bacterium]|nr:hypothetical protein [Gemmataceae bacterium]